MPEKGREIHIEPFTIANEQDVVEVGRFAATKAIRAFLSMMMGDPDPDYGYGIKRGAFRQADLMPLAVENSMTITLSKGSALLEGVEDGETQLYLVYAGDNEKSITLEPAESASVRYDLVYLEPRQNGTDNVTRDAVDENGEISPVNFDRVLVDDFDICISKNFPHNNLDPTNAHEALPQGNVPIALVTVDPGVTEITQDKIKDLREIFRYRAFPVNETDGGIDGWFPLQVPNHNGQLHRVNTVEALQWVPLYTMYLDCTGATPVLKYRTDGDNHFTVNLTAVTT